MTKLNNWSVVSNPYDAPELNRLYFSGIVYGHTYIPDGETIRTSKIVGFNDGVFITLSGTEYALESVDPDYEKEFPNSLERIMESAKKLNNINERADGE